MAFEVSGITVIDGTRNITANTIIVSGITYPTSDGTSGQVIITDGSGNLSFSTVSIDGSSYQTKADALAANTSLVALIDDRMQVSNVSTLVSTEVAALVDSAPTTLDTLNELAAALGDDPNFATTITASLGTKASNTYVNTQLGLKTDSTTFNAFVANTNTFIATKADSSSLSSYLQVANAAATYITDAPSNGTQYARQDGAWAAVTATGGISYSVSTSNVTASADEGILADTSGGSFTVTLPASPSSGDKVFIADADDFSVNNLTVARNGSTIEGASEDFILDIGGHQVGFIYNGSTWQVYPQAGLTSIRGISDSANSAAITINASKNVGIGTASPIHNLDVTSSTASTAVSMRVGPTASSGDNDGTLIINNGGSGDAMLRFDYEGYTDRARIGVTGSGQHLGFYTAGANERMRIDSSGNVMIKNTTGASFTLNAATDLSIGSGSASAGMTIYTGSSNQGAISFADGTTGDQQYRGYIVYTHSNDGMIIGTAGQEALRIDSSGNLLLNTTNEIQFYTSGYGIRASTGLEIKANDFTRFLKGSTEYMRIDPSGNVGIGTSSPSTKLHISGGDPSIRLTPSSTNDARVDFTDNTGTVRWYTGFDESSGNYVVAADEGGFSSSNIVVVNDSGNVGIGTTSPDAPLHIETANGVKSEINLSQTAVTNYRISVPASTDALTFLYGTSTERMRIDSSGNVGIGQSNPTSKLAVSNSGYESFEIDPVGVDGQIRLFSYDRNAGGVGSYIPNTWYGTAWDFYDGQVGTYRMRINSSGNVTIGTSLNTGKLVVQGVGSNAATNATIMYNASGTGLFYIRDDGAWNTGGAANSPYFNTTASAANLNVSSAGFLARSTSSARYKENIRDYDQPVSIDALRPVFFNSKNEDDDKTYAGLIAEEVHEAGFTEFVEYNKDGEPDAVFYANMVALCIKEIQDLKAEVAALKGE